MSLWGKQNAVESRPKHLPNDSNAPHGREFCQATDKGWTFQPGVASAATGNDNTSADPEILVAIRSLASTLASANLLSIDYTAGAYADAATFDLVLTFDEPITVTSATATANQTVTNKAFILLSRLGGTDMVEDNTVACQYLSGSGTNTLTFRGSLQSADAGFLSFSDKLLHFNGTATMVDGNSEAIHGIADEQTITDSIVMDASASGTDEGGKILLETMRMDLEGADLATDIMGTQAYRTGFGVDNKVGRVAILEDDSGKIQLETSADGIAAESFTVDADGLVVETKSGSSSGSAAVLKGVTTT
jgi:hypothetical protein